MRHKTVPLLKILSLFAITVCSGIFYAQDGISKSYYLNGNIESEISYVEDVLVGTSYWYYENGNLKEEKNYTNGKLNGWIKKYFEDGLLAEEYYVKDGVKDGVDRTYFNNGALKSVHSYEQGILIKRVDLDFDSLYEAPPEAYLAGNRQYKIQSRKEELLCDADVCPIPINGIQALQDSLHYPEHAKLYGLEGSVKLIAEINSKGIVTHTEVVEGIGLGCDEEAQRVIEEAKFLPGVTGGIPVNSSLIIRLFFKLDEKPAIAENLSGEISRQIIKSVRPQATEKNEEKTEREAKPPQEDVEVKTCDLEFCPKPRGGIQKILEKIVMPPTAERMEINGTVIIDVDVDEYGFARDTEIIQGLGYGIDEAVEVAMFETEFDPGIDKGKYKRTLVRLVIPIINRETD